MATLVVNGVSLLTTTTLITAGMTPQAVIADIGSNIRHLAARVAKNKAGELAVLLTGERASEKLAVVIGSHLQMPTTVFGLKTTTPPFHLAYATAVSGVLAPANEESINLLPRKLHLDYLAQEKYQITRRSFWLALALGITAIAVAMVGLIWLLIRNATLNAEAAAVSVSAKKDAGFDVNAVYPKAQRYLEIYTRKITPEYEIGLIYQNLPQGITPNQVAYAAKGGSYTLSGTADSREAMLALKVSLDATDAFEPLKLPLQVLENSRNFSFTVALIPKKGLP
jgi:hypothetical protein